MSKSGKKLSTFEKKKSQQKRTTEASTEKLVQIALIFSWFFLAAPKILVDFSQQVHKAHENSNCQSLTLPIHGLLNPLCK